AGSECPRLGAISTGKPARFCAARGNAGIARPTSTEMKESRWRIDPLAQSHVRHCRWAITDRVTVHALVTPIGACATRDIHPVCGRFSSLIRLWSIRLSVHVLEHRQPETALRERAPMATLACAGPDQLKLVE